MFRGLSALACCQDKVIVIPGRVDHESGLSEDGLWREALALFLTLETLQRRIL